jgi:hypothetical protein
MYIDLSIMIVNYNWYTFIEQTIMPTLINNYRNKFTAQATEPGFKL